MGTYCKITVGGVLSEGFSIGSKNLASIFIASVLWLVTIWIPYLNVGTTIAMMTIPIELSKGKIISPMFIFDGKYRQFMGEYFTLTGLICLSVIPAMCFMIIPGIVISIGWSLAYYILLDKKVAPGEALVQSNKATCGYKWTIFGVGILLGIAYYILQLILIWIIGDSSILLLFLILLISLYLVVRLGCEAVIYRNLMAEDKVVVEE